VNRVKTSSGTSFWVPRAVFEPFSWRASEKASIKALTYLTFFSFPGGGPGVWTHFGGVFEQSGNSPFFTFLTISVDFD